MRPSLRTLWSALILLSGALAESTNPFPVKKCNGLVIEDVDIDTVQSYFHRNLLTAQQLTQCYIDRINLLNPYFHTVIQINPDALSIARALDVERVKSGPRGPLHGVPILTKDNIATDDKVPTTAGSLALLNSTVPRDSHVAALLRLSGAVLLGHANMAEFADYIAYDNYSEGYSDRGGQTRNCFNATQQTSGSSSGSAQSVHPPPAMHAGIVGIKPTVGRVSRAGVIPGSLSQDTVGPHARTFRDAAYILDAISGVDMRDNATFTALISGAAMHTNFSDSVADAGALKGAKFGIPWDVLWSSTAGAATHRAALLDVLSQIEAAGAILYNNTDIPRIRDLQDPYGWGDALDTPMELWARTYLHVDLYNGLDGYLRDLKSSPIRSFEELLEWEDANNASTGALGGGYIWVSGADNFVRANATHGVTDEGYYLAKLWRHELSKPASTPRSHTSPPTAPSPNSTGCSGIPAAAHYPAVTFPVGQDPWQLPFGLGIWGTAFSEAKLIRYGSAIDDLVRWRGKPRYVNYETTRVPFDARWPGFFDPTA
ncbi:amidase signature domain-containing protein [Mycena leptocephala]|nr:amidase signature domain-containing protein [Mycena leptocephala]